MFGVKKNRAVFLFLGVVFLCLLAAISILTRPLIPSPYNISSTQVRSPVNHIELKIIENADLPKSKFELGYLFGHGFHEVDFKGNRYTQMDREVVFKKPTPENSKADYQILVSGNTVKIIDLNLNKNIAFFNMPPDGWPGDQAGKFLATILKPDYFSIAKKKIEPSSHDSLVELREPTATMEANERSGLPKVVYGCPIGFDLVTGKLDHHSSAIRTPQWTLLSPWGLEEVVCTPQGVLIFAQHRQEDLGVTWIDYDGSLRGSAVVLNRKMNLRYQYHQTKILSTLFTKDRLIVERAYFLRNLHTTTKASYEAIFDIPLSELAINR